jgi:hypothetical protein
MSDTDRVERVARALALADDDIDADAWAYAAHNDAYECVKYRHLARAALAVADQWQTIESAPRDGTWFLIVNERDGWESMEVGCYEPLTVERFVEAGDGLYRREMGSAYDWRGFNNFHRATHWRPLPAPPEAK